MIEIERVCENCTHWLRASSDLSFGVCHIHAVDPDVGQGVRASVLLPGNATCLAYDDAFEPSEVYLDYLREAEKPDDC